MKRTVLLTLIFFFFTGSTLLLAQSPCDCEGNFKWVRETFEKNDAGFEYVLEQKGKAAYEKHTSAILEKIKNTTDKAACVTVITEWLSFFRKAHFTIASINDQAAAATGKSTPWPVIAVSEGAIRKAVQNSASVFEGIWGTGNYTIGIVKNGEGYKGMILSATGNNWKPNQVKLEIAKNLSGTYYMGDYSPVKFAAPEMIGKNAMKLGSIYLYKIYPHSPEEDGTALYAREMATSGPFIQELSKETVLLRIPSFDDSQRILIDSLVTSNSRLFSAKKNLIIDIRNNGGGSDISYGKVIPLLYTNPIRITSTELLSTPLNNQRMAGYLNTPGISERSKNQVNAALEKLNANLGKFVNLSNEVVSIQTIDSVLPNPKSVAIIINQNNGSTAEQFLLAAKQSKKVKLYGKTTMGVLDISNMYFVESPDKQFRLGYSLSKSLRIPDMMIDNIGIQPDYYIDKSIPDEKWLDFVKGILEQ